MKRIKDLCIFLCFILVLAFVPTKISEATTKKEMTVSNPFCSMSVEVENDDGWTDKYSEKDSSDIEKTLHVGAQVSYNQDNIFSDYYRGKAIKLTVSTEGVLVFKLKAVQVEREIETSLFEDPLCENRIKYLTSLFIGSAESKYATRIQKAGTYYIGMDSWYSIYDLQDKVPFTNIFDVDIEFYTTEDLTLTEDKWHDVGKPYDDAYYKIDMPYTGYLTIYGDQDFGYQILDENKKTCSEKKEDTGDLKTVCRLQAGSYYLKTVKSWYNDLIDLHCKIKYTISKDEELMECDKNVTIYPASENEITYLKVIPSVDGYIKVNVPKSNTSDKDGCVVLCNENKKVITKKKKMADDKKFAVWGVEKGKTYYIKASGFEGKTELVYHQIKVNEKSGLTRKKAVKIARNKWIKGTIAAGNSNVDWYKIKLSKNAKFKIQAKGVASGSIQVKICNKKGKVLCIETIVSGQKSYNLNSKKSYKKGTYYIVICRKNSKASGMYQIKWK